MYCGAIQDGSHRAQDVSMSWHQDHPKPYTPGTGCYLEDVDWEAEIRKYENQRPGSMDLKAFVLFRDGRRCRQCGVRVTHETSQADHIRPVHGFASYAQATKLSNLQTLCLECHKPKTYAHDSLESRMQGNLHVRFGVGAGVQFPGLHHAACGPSLTSEMFARGRHLLHFGLFQTLRSHIIFSDFADFLRRRSCTNRGRLPGPRNCRGGRSLRTSVRVAAWNLERTKLLRRQSPEQRARCCLRALPPARMCQNGVGSTFAVESIVWHSNTDRFLSHFRVSRRRIPIAAFLSRSATPGSVTFSLHRSVTDSLPPTVITPITFSCTSE